VGCDLGWDPVTMQHAAQVGSARMGNMHRHNLRPHAAQQWCQALARACAGGRREGVLDTLGA
jgi:hypothetical protein